MTEENTQQDPLGQEERRLMKAVTGEQARLDYPTHTATNAAGFPVEIYDIPEADKPSILQQLYMFAGVPAIDKVLFCIHERKEFTVKDFLVTRQDGCNFLVSPYYLNTGGTVLDWIEPEFSDQLPEF